MKVIGLTGGIGSGKTTVSDWLANQGIPIVDADVVACNLLKCGSPLLLHLKDVFGSWVLDDKGNYNRSAMRRFIFDDPKALANLNAIVHPAVFKTCQARIQEASKPVILSVPLLVESRHKSPSLFGLCDGIWVVDIPTSLQLKRVCQRSQLPKSEVQKIIQNQATRTERLSFATEVIDNRFDLEHLYSQLKTLYTKYFAACHKN